MNYIAKKIRVDLGKSNDPSDPRTVMQLLQMVVGAWAKLAVGRAQIRGCLGLMEGLSKKQPIKMAGRPHGFQ